MNAPAPRRNYDMAELKRLDMAHHLPAQTDYRLQHQLGGSRIITRADGCVITDAEGKSLLDGMAGLWCVNIGYGRAELAEVAREQMLELPYYNTFFKTATPSPIQLAAKVASLMQKGNPDLSHVFFNASGSEANDTIFRLVRHYWTLKGEAQRKVFISRRNAYHGSTVAGASLGAWRLCMPKAICPLLVLSMWPSLIVSMTALAKMRLSFAIGWSLISKRG